MNIRRAIMKLVGKVMLLVAGILFLVWGIWGTIDATNVLINLISQLKFDGAVIISLISSITQILAGIGAIFFFIGIGPFRGFVGVFALINFVIIVVNLVFNIINKASLIYLTSLSTVTCVVYFIGWALARKK